MICCFFLGQKFRKNIHPYPCPNYPSSKNIDSRAPDWFSCSQSGVRAAIIDTTLDCDNNSKVSASGILLASSCLPAYQGAGTLRTKIGKELQNIGFKNLNQIDQKEVTSKIDFRKNIIIKRFKPKL